MLARSVTEIVHGKAAAERSEAVSQVLYGERSLNSLSVQERQLVLTDAPSARVSLGIPVAEALVLANLSSSKSDARRLIEGNGVSINDERITDPAAVLESSHFDGPAALLRRGRQTAILVRN